MCRTKTLGEVKEEATPTQIWTLGALRSNKLAEAWRKIIYIDGEPMSFKIDTGADVNAVSPGIATTLRTATPSMIKLYGAGGQPLNVLGKLTAVLRCAENSFRDELYVMESL